MKVIQIHLVLSKIVLKSATVIKLDKEIIVQKSKKTVSVTSDLNIE